MAEQDLDKFLQEWIEVAKGVGPINLEKAKAAISKIYSALENGQYPPPKYWVYCLSPLDAILRVQVLKTELELADLDNTEDIPADKMANAVRKAETADVSKVVRNPNLLDDTVLWGQNDAYWIASHIYCIEFLNMEYPQETKDILKIWKEITLECFWWWPFKEVCFLSERPQGLSFDDRGRLHSESGPAYGFKDGWGAYYWHGIRTEPHVIMNPEKITVKEIEECDNQELRRIKVERYGTVRYLHDAEAKEIHRDKFGVLYKKTLPDGEEIAMVKVLNNTPEPDGTRKEYFLACDPQAQTAKAGVASTFGLAEEEYNPQMES